MVMAHGHILFIIITALKEQNELMIHITPLIGVLLEVISITSAAKQQKQWKNMKLLSINQSQYNNKHYRLKIPKNILLYMSGVRTVVQIL